MAAYLIAIAAGDLAYAPVSSRCGVWAESSVVEKAAYEFAETEDFLSAAEQVCGHGALPSLATKSPITTNAGLRAWCSF
jgi:hypothetical protein